MQARLRAAGMAAEDVAKAIVWFAGDETSHVTGQAFNVNGGSWMN